MEVECYIDTLDTYLHKEIINKCFFFPINFIHNVGNLGIIVTSILVRV